jgi:3-deoxy-D-manno-octulosonate 8-phosphate phosphatase (KDO 8-P phosphatase)
MNVLQLFKDISAFVFDIDGVLTDGSLLVLKDGLMARSMNIKDGYAMQLAVKKGYKVILISGSHSAEVTLRLQKLGIADIFMEVTDKQNFLVSYVHTHNLDYNKMLYMGDDIPDLASMRLVHLPCCPKDAVSEIKQASRYISAIKGGNGCVRDVIEKVLKLHDHWDLDTQTASL